MSKNSVGPVTDWMHKRDFPAVQRLDEENNAWEGWSQQQFITRLREKNVIGMVSKVADVVGAFVVYEYRDKEMLLLKFETAKALVSSRIPHVLVAELKRKAVKYKKNLVVVFPEARESIEKYQFFAKEGFKSKLKRNFFTFQSEIRTDGYEFTWNFEENDNFASDFEKIEAGQ